MFTYSLSGLQLDDAESAPAVPIEENETTARSAVYQVLGALMSPPDAEHHEKALDGRWRKEVETAAELLPFSVDLDPPDLDDAVSLSDYQDEFSALFGAGGSERLRAAAYLDTGLDEVDRSYEYFGLGVPDDGLPADHLGTECDFMQFVTYKEAAARSSRLQGSFRRAQYDFLDRHLRVWVPELVAAVADTSSFWGGVVGLVDRFTDADHTYLSDLG